MSYTSTDWKTGDVITAEKLNNMENGIVSGQNNVEFVKLVTLSMQAYAESPETGTGGPLPDGKTLGDLVGNKTIIGLASMYRYDGSGGNSNFDVKKPPVSTVLTYSGSPIGLWELPDHMNDTSVSVTVKWGYLFYQGSQSSTFNGELDVYAICI